jgi:hypothetical protein
VVQQTPCDARKPADLARILSLEKALGIDRMNQLKKEELAKFRAEAMERIERERKLAPEDEFVPPPAAP